MADPLAQFFETKATGGGGDPLSQFFEAPTVPRGTSKPREQILAEHQANLEASGQTMVDTPGGGRAVVPLAPNLMGQAKEFMGAPGRLISGMTGIARDIGRMDEPLERKLMGYGEQAIKGIGTGLGKLIYGTPEEQAGVAGDITLGLATGGVRPGAQAITGAITRRAEQAPARALAQGTNQIVAGLKPNMRTVKALKNVQGDIAQHLDETGRSIVNTKSLASVTQDTADKFYQGSYLPIKAEISKVEIPFKGDVVDADTLFARREEINKMLGRVGYYDKNPVVQRLAASAPGTAQALDEIDDIRKALNTAADTLAPTNVGAANILRHFSDLKQVADHARIRAERVELANMIKAGEAATFSEAVKDAALTLSHGFAVKPALAIDWSRQIVRALRSSPDPDTLIAKGAKNWAKGREAAAVPRPVQRTPIPMRGPDVVPPGTQGELPFVPPGVGGVIPGGISPGAGSAMPGGMGRSGLGDVFESLSRGQVGPGRAPTQLALPPAGSTQLPGSLQGPREMPNPNQLFFGGRLASPQLPKVRTRNLEDALRRVQENPPEPFRGDTHSVIE